MKCPRCNGKRCEPDNSRDLVWRACKMCHGTGVVPDNNENWFCSLTTEEKAKVLRRRTYGNSEGNESVEQGWINWLKAKHEDNPPDIPGVPSWDKWLEGEKTKCEYCDGNGVECDLYGRSECPKTPKTEQEYIQTCTTEQLAEALFSWYKLGRLDVINKHTELKKDWLIGWLKQPHKPFS